MIEFDVANGGSINMWKSVFGKNSKIIGVDINPKAKIIENKNVNVFIGDQENREFLRKMMSVVGNVDIVIEDGDHEMNQQINTFEEVFPYVKNNGVFLIEDLHTSYFDDFGGGFQRKGTFIEFSKSLIDVIKNNEKRNSYNTQKT
jgi:23S rRNA U2552 (ribose-2'-O)-methylase RlmE/FtsJ